MSSSVSSECSSGQRSFNSDALQARGVRAAQSVGDARFRAARAPILLPLTAGCSIAIYAPRSRLIFDSTLARYEKASEKVFLCDFLPALRRTGR